MSVETLLEHRRLWARKPELACVYRPWFERILAELAAGTRVLEVAAGPGFLADYARQRRPDLRWTASELLPARWNDVAATADRLPFGAGTFGALAALDALHHLASPRHFFREAARVLEPGGTLVAVEPWVSPFSFPIYRWLHQESCTPGLDPWHPFPAGSAKRPFDGDAAVPRRLAGASPSTWAELGFGTPRVERLNCFAYLLSLGFREGSLLPGERTRRWLMALDDRTRRLAGLLALRAVLVWRREEEPPHPAAPPVRRGAPTERSKGVA